MDPDDKNRKLEIMLKSGDREVLSKREEQRLISAGRRVLLSGGFPNPERAGCPQSDLLKAIAFGRKPLCDATQSIDHIGCCSPCFIEYVALKKDAQKQKTLQFVLATAALLIVAVFGGWIWRIHRLSRPAGNVATNELDQKVTVDLRNRLVLRGDQAPSANSGPIELPRGRMDLTLLLPKDANTGIYGVEVSTMLAKPLIATPGTEVNEHGVATLKLKVDLSKLSPGTYLLAIKEPSGQRRQYPLRIK